MPDIKLISRLPPYYIHWCILRTIFGESFWGLSTLYGSHFWDHFWGPYLGSFLGPFQGTNFREPFQGPFCNSGVKNVGGDSTIQYLVHTVILKLQYVLIQFCLSIFGPPYVSYFFVEVQKRAWYENFTSFYEQSSGE